MGAAMDYLKVEGHFDKVAIIGSGLSLKGSGISEYLDRHAGYVIAVNDAWRGFVNPDLVITIDTIDLDRRFRGCPKPVVVGVPEGFGTPEALCVSDRKLPHFPFDYMKRRHGIGFSEEKDTLFTADNSGFAAFNYAYHLRPRDIYLFGIDLVDWGAHWHDHSDPGRPPKNQGTIAERFAYAAPQLAREGISVQLCSPINPVKCWPKMSVAQGIAEFNQYG